MVRHFRAKTEQARGGGGRRKGSGPGVPPCLVHHFTGHAVGTFVQGPHLEPFAVLLTCSFVYATRQLPWTLCQRVKVVWDNPLHDPQQRHKLDASIPCLRSHRCPNMLCATACARMPTNCKRCWHPTRGGGGLGSGRQPPPPPTNCCPEAPWGVVEGAPGGHQGGRRGGRFPGGGGLSGTSEQLGMHPRRDPTIRTAPSHVRTAPSHKRVCNHRCLPLQAPQPRARLAPEGGIFSTQ